MTRVRKTCRRYNVPGDAHFLTFSCFRRMPLLAKERTCQWFADAWVRTEEKHEVDLWAYVIMPEHVHLLVYPRRQVYSISAVLKSLKLSVTNKAIDWLKEDEPAFLEEMCDRQPNGDVAYWFWQRGGGHDVNLWDPGRIWDKIEYMHANPVRRGLCEQPVDWRWSSARDFERSGRGPILLNHEYLPGDLRQLRQRGWSG